MEECSGVPGSKAGTVFPLIAKLSASEREVEADVQAGDEAVEVWE